MVVVTIQIVAEVNMYCPSLGGASLLNLTVQAFAGSNEAGVARKGRRRIE